MKAFVLFVFLSVPIMVFSQKETGLRHQVFLKDGSVLYGRISEDPERKTVTVVLSNGSEVVFPDTMYLYSRSSKAVKVIFNDGRRTLERGRYATISVQSLTANRSTDSENELRWGMGAHYSTGYRFNPGIGLGGGIGIDMHQYFFAPVFMEISGYLVNNKFRTNKKERPARDKNDFWFDGAFNEWNPKRRFPLSYSLQLGYNIPVDELFDNENIENLRGGALIYPSVGFLFPSRHGSTFRIDFGYKFQSYSREYTPQWWGNFRTRETITLRSFTVRAGFIF